MLKQIQLIERIDQLIRLQATGSPVELAAKLGISKTKLYRMLCIMKELDAPVEFDTLTQSFVYSEPVGFTFGFYKKGQKTNSTNPSIG